MILNEQMKLDFLRSPDGRLISAASGLVRHKDVYYVIADDQLSLAVFSLNIPSHHYFVPLISGDLPTDKKLRKKVKPDWEALVALTIEGDFFTLLAVPSGSTTLRTRGVRVNFQNQKVVSTKFVDFTILYHHLQTRFQELNIEGAAVKDNVLNLFQRGNGRSAQNAVIDLDLKKVLANINESGVINPECIIQIKEYDLGQIKNVNLSFTDACYCTDGSLFFLAAAEDIQSTYDDGAYVGAVLGQLNTAGEVISVTEVECPAKPEGLWVDKTDTGYKIYIVTDADNPDQTSQLYFGKIESMTKLR